MQETTMIGSWLPLVPEDGAARRGAATGRTT